MLLPVAYLRGLWRVGVVAFFAFLPVVYLLYEVFDLLTLSPLCVFSYCRASVLRNESLVTIWDKMLSWLCVIVLSSPGTNLHTLRSMFRAPGHRACTRYSVCLRERGESQSSTKHHSTKASVGPRLPI